jgi:hypothetical protein
MLNINTTKPKEIKTNISNIIPTISNIIISSVIKLLLKETKKTKEGAERKEKREGNSKRKSNIRPVLFRKKGLISKNPYNRAGDCSPELLQRFFRILCSVGKINLQRNYTPVI